MAEKTCPVCEWAMSDCVCHKRVRELEALLSEMVQGHEWIRNQYGGWLENGAPALHRARAALANRNPENPSMPAMLDARQDTVHKPSTKIRAGKTARNPGETSEP